MSRIDRRSFIPLLIGLIASLSGLASVAWLRQRRCTDGSGQWDAAARVCTGQAGPIDVSRASDVAAGIIVCIALVFMLHRASTFASRRRASS